MKLLPFPIVFAAFALMACDEGSGASEHAGPTCTPSKQESLENGDFTYVWTTEDCDDGTCRNCCSVTHGPSGDGKKDCTDCGNECEMPSISLSSYAAEMRLSAMVMKTVSGYLTTVNFDLPRCRWRGDARLREALRRGKGSAARGPLRRLAVACYI